MVSLLSDFWEEMMELHDKIDPKNNINQIFYHIMSECPVFNLPLGYLVGVHPMHLE